MHFPPAFTMLPPSERAQALIPQWQSLAATLEASGGLADTTFLAGLDAVGADAAPSSLALLEAIAECSGPLAALMAMRGAGTGPAIAALPGMRRHTDPGDDQCLRLAAVAVGLGRRAVALTVSEARTRGDRPSGLPDAPPHWLLADAATDVDAARLLVLHASGLDAPAVLLAAASAAVRAADVAQRLHEASEPQDGTDTVERLGRQARALLTVVGGEDALRRRAADALLA